MYLAVSDALTQEEQKYANIFLHDIERGDVIAEDGKTLRDYITEYQFRAKDDQIHRFATIFGLDEDKLRNMMGLNLNEATINEFGRFDELKKSVDKSKAKAFFEAYEQTKLIPPKELKKDCHRKQYIRSRDAETPFQVMSYSTMTFQESEIYGEDVLEDTECNVEESVMQRMDIERVRTALKMLAPEERAIIQDFFFTESPIPVKELVEKYAMPKTSIYRKRDDALKKLKKILGNA